MADLDDFFAKKDRKKSKAVKKFATADELAKKLDDPKQKSDVRPKKERPAQEVDEAGRAKEEEEWKEYEEPVKDYTGLKIQVLQGGNNAQDSGRDAGSDDMASDGSGKVKGPWKKQQVEVEAPPPPPVVEEPVVREPRSTAYVPPTLRARPDPPLRRHQSKHAPDITNDDTFPVLGAGGAKRAPPAPPSHRLALGNRYTALQDHS